LRNSLEFWNFWAATKWEYHVPYLGHIKIFEMPVLGFLGFLPFAVESYAIYVFIRRLIPSNARCATLDKLAVLRSLLSRAEGLIFDFDGLLADSERFHFMTYDEVFRRYGHSLDPQEYNKYWTSLGHGVKGEIDRHGLDLDPVAIRREKMPIFSRYCEDGSIRLFDEAREMISVFSQMGKRLAIASGTPRAMFARSFGTRVSTASSRSFSGATRFCG